MSWALARFAVLSAGLLGCGADSGTRADARPASGSVDGAVARPSDGAPDGAPDGELVDSMVSADARLGDARVEPADAQPPAAQLADVTAVSTSGSSGAYQFAVEIRSPDTGCERYADWWEIVDEEGALLYRRILAHSHVDEQPFTRSGGPVDVAPGQQIWVRAHLAPGGYGGQLFRGSVEGGFEAMVPPAGFAAGLDRQAPLPQDCAF